MKTIEIGLLWHTVAAGNLGLGALTVGNIALARAAAARASVAPHFTIFAPDEGGVRYVSDNESSFRGINGRYMIAPSGYASDLKRIDIMLDIGAGDSFTDIYANKRFAYLVATKALALWKGVPLVLSPQTIGPFSRQPHTAIAAWICRKARLVCARDPLSMAALARIAPNAQSLQVIDVAFALPFDRPARRPDGPIKVGINVSGLLMIGGYTGGNDNRLGFDYAALTRKLVQALVATPGIEVHLVPHVIAPHLPGDDDGIASDQLAAEFPQLHRHPDFASPSEAKSFISGLDFFVGARMHATIAAYSTGVPVVPVSYSRKFEGLFGGLDYPWVVPARGMDTETALAFILDAFSRRAELAADIGRGTPVIVRGLEDYTAALAEQFVQALPT